MDLSRLQAHLAILFPAGQLTKEEEALIKDIIESREAGIEYDHALSVRILYYIINRKGKEYKNLIRYTKYRIWNSTLRHKVDVRDLTQQLVEKVALTQKNRVWKYNTTPFIVFAKGAINSMIYAILAKKTVNIINKDILDISKDDEVSPAYNKLANVPAPQTTSLEDDFIAQETFSACTEYVKSHDPIAYDIMLLAEEMTFEEIAKELGIRVNDVANGKKRLKRILPKFYPLAGTEKLYKRKNKRRKNNGKNS